TQVRTQLLILASELTAANFVAGNITSLTFTVTTAGSQPMNNFTIKVGHTNVNVMTTVFETSPLTQVYFVPTFSMVTGQNTHVFQTPFFWDGVSNLIIETC